MKHTRPKTQEQQIEEYLKQQVSKPGYFARTGWQTWQELAINRRETFPVSIEKYLFHVVQPLLLPVCHSNLDLLLFSYYKTHGEHMFPDRLSNYLELTQDQLREKKWETLTSSMTTSLTLHLLNHQGSTLVGARSRE